MKINSKKFLLAFFGENNVDIYLPVRYVEILKRGLIANEDFYSGQKMSEFLNNYKIKNKFIEVKETDAIDPKTNSVIICGPKSNAYIHEVLSYDPNYEFVFKDNKWAIVYSASKHEFFSPLDQEPTQNCDYAYLNKFKKDNKKIIIVSGIHSIGSMGGIDFLANEKNIKKWKKEFGEKNFSCLITSKFDNNKIAIESSSVFIAAKEY